MVYLVRTPFPPPAAPTLCHHLYSIEEKRDDNEKKGKMDVLWLLNFESKKKKDVIGLTRNELSWKEQIDLEIIEK